MSSTNTQLHHSVYWVVAAYQPVWADHTVLSKEVKHSELRAREEKSLNILKLKSVIF